MGRAFRKTCAVDLDIGAGRQPLNLPQDYIMVFGPKK